MIGIFKAEYVYFGECTQRAEIQQFLRWLKKNYDFWEEPEVYKNVRPRGGYLVMVRVKEKMFP